VQHARIAGIERYLALLSRYGDGNERYEQQQQYNGCAYAHEGLHDRECDRIPTTSAL